LAYYNFRNTLTNVESVEEMAISELDGYIEANPHMHQLPSTGIRLSYAGYGVHVDDGFRSVLKKIKKDYPRSTIELPGIKVNGKKKS
jgi:hypothetical protein